jgi:hypothetical protein
MAINSVKISIEQCHGNYHDANTIKVEMDDEMISEQGRRVFIRQEDETAVDDETKEHLIFIDSKKSLKDLIKALQFVADQKGWKV